MSKDKMTSVEMVISNLTEEERRILKKRILEISKKYGVDCHIKDIDNIDKRRD